MNDAFKKHLPLDLAEWVLPAAGMFIVRPSSLPYLLSCFSILRLLFSPCPPPSHQYVRIKAEKHPQISKLSAEGVLDNVFEAIIKEGCITVPSTLFKADKDLPSAPEDVYLRCSFSYNDHAEFEEGAKRFGAGIRKSFGVCGGLQWKTILGLLMVIWLG
jgi:DNA-binding transcriptional MocR family regulator